MVNVSIMACTDDTSVVTIAQYLSTFQSYYQGRDGPLGHSISKQDIFDAFDFRELVLNHQNLQEQYNCLEHLNPKEDEQWKNTIRNIEIQLAGIPSGIKAVHRMLLRLEVWSTKALVKHVLLDSKDECLTLLNIPDASYFQRILPPPATDPWKMSENPQETVAKLALAPNTWTCEEYLRLLPMMMAPTNLLLQLWVRAQRNTSARLVLDSCFVLTLEPPQERMRVTAGARSGKVILQNMDINETPRYVARYVKNEIQYDYEEHARLVNEMVEWAVTNQVLFTRSYIRTVIYQGDMHFGRNLPSHEDSDMDESIDLEVSSVESASTNKRASVENISPPLKRNRRDDDDCEDSDLMEHCQRLVLRWFARRNRKQTSVIFTTLVDINPWPIYRDLVKSLYPVCTPQIKAKMEGYETGRMDRTFSRLERRCNVLNFKESVCRVLNALEESLIDVDCDLTQPEVRTTIQDFEHMCALFLDGKTAMESAHSLLSLDSSAHNVDEIKSMLSWVPSPWLDRCSRCQGAFEYGATWLKCCDNCDRNFHRKCDTKLKTNNVIHLAELFKPLAQVYSVRIPEKNPIPDFSGRIKWTRIEIPIVRKRQKDGTYAKMGLALMATRKAQEYFSLLESGMLYSTFMLNWKTNFLAFRLDQIGFVVVTIANSSDGSGMEYTGMAMGISKNDVIVAARLDGILFDFSALSCDDCISLLLKCSRGSNPSDRLFIQRPDSQVNIIDNARIWLQRVAKASQFLNSAMNVENRLSVCASCSADAVSKSIGEQARRCKAVIRRLGLESYSVPFHNESFDESFDDRKHVSFRRLDRMMESILEKYCNESEHEVVAKECTNLVAPFLCPTFCSTKEGETCIEQKRLSWAPECLEKQPLALLCKGMSILLAPPWVFDSKENNDESDPLLKERTALSTHFLHLFCTWCLSGGTDAALLSTSGPPVGAFFARQPWLVETCCICIIRPISEFFIDGTRGVCDNFACRRLCHPGSFHNTICPNQSSVFGTETVDMDESEGGKVKLPVNDCALQCYDELASLVGKCILILPEDGALVAVAKELNLNIDHGGPPTPFVVFSYLPRQLGGFFDEASYDEDGIFYLYPITSRKQLTYLGERFKMQSPPDSDLKESLFSWMKLDVLSELGVLRLKPSELWRRLAATHSMRESIDRSVAALCSEANSLGEKFTLGGGILPVEFGKSVSCEVDMAGPPGRVMNIECFSRRKHFDDHRRPHFRSVVMAKGICSRYTRLLDGLFSCNVDVLSDISRSLSDMVDGDNSYVSSDDEIDFEMIDVEDQKLPQQLTRDIGDLPGEQGEPATNKVIDKGEEEDKEEWFSPLEVLNVEQDEPTVLAHPLFLFNRKSPSNQAQQVERIDLAPLLDAGLSDRRSASSQAEQVEPIDLSPPLVVEISDRHCTLSQAEQVEPRDLAPPLVVEISDRHCTLSQAEPVEPIDLAPPLIVEFSDRKGPSRQAAQEEPMKFAPPLAMEFPDHEIPNSQVEQQESKSLPVAVELSDRKRPTCQAKQVEPKGLAPPLTAEFSDRNSFACTWSPSRVQNAVHPESVNSRRHLKNLVIFEDPKFSVMPTGHVGTSEILCLPHPAHTFEGSNSQVNPSRFLIFSDLYSPCPEGIILTKVETAVLIYALNAGLPKLSIRLLHPRYSWSMARDLCVGIQRADTSLLPRIQKEFWDILMGLDFARSKNETGKIIAFDGEFRYRCPTVSLPLDRHFEDFLRGSQFRASLNKPFNNMIPSHSFWRDNDSIERIRGGSHTVADEESENGEPPEILNSLPTTVWKNQAVYCEVDVGDNEEAIILGFVDDYDETTVKVAVAHVSTLGMLRDTHFEFLPSSLLQLVRNGSKHASLLIEWGNTYDETGKYLLLSGINLAQPDIGTGNGFVSQERGISDRKPAISSSSNDNSVIEAAWALVRKLSQKSKRFCQIGRVPDGRAVFWTAADPGALYIRWEDRRQAESLQNLKWLQEQYLEQLRKVTDDQLKGRLRFPTPNQPFACPWGCYCRTADNGAHMQAMSFSSMDELVFHIGAYHEYSDGENIKCRDIGALNRIGTGESIRMVAASIATSICARNHSLLVYTIEREHTNDPIICSDDPDLIMFDYAKFLDFSKEGRGCVANEVHDRLQNDADTLQLCRLYSRIARLWDIQIDGRYWLCANENSRCSRLSRLGERVHQADLRSDCYLRSPQSTGQFNCSVCSQLDERGPAGKDRYKSLGCLAFSEVYFPTNAPIENMLKGSGLTTKVKFLLINLASQIPESLRRERTDTCKPREDMWEVTEHQTWYQHVTRFNRLNSALQASVVLMYSIDKQKMPLWWKEARGGWASSHAIMSLPSFSSLALFLYVFDAAVCEYNGKLANTIPRQSVRMATVE